MERRTDTEQNGRDEKDGDKRIGEYREDGREHCFDLEMKRRREKECSGERKS